MFRLHSAETAQRAPDDFVPARHSWTTLETPLFPCLHSRHTGIISHSCGRPRSRGKRQLFGVTDASAVSAYARRRGSVRVAGGRSGSRTRSGETYHRVSVATRNCPLGWLSPTLMDIWVEGLAAVIVAANDLGKNASGRSALLEAFPGIRRGDSDSCPPNARHRFLGAGSGGHSTIAPSSCWTAGTLASVGSAGAALPWFITRRRSLPDLRSSRSDFGIRSRLQVGMLTSLILEALEPLCKRNLPFR